MLNIQQKEIFMKEFKKNIAPHLDNLANTMLFNSIPQNHILTILTFLSPEIKKYRKDQLIIDEGDTVNSLSIIIEGSVHIQTLDYWGNINIKANIGQYGIFGETFTCLPDIKANCQAIAQSDCVILNLDINTVLQTKESSTSELPYYNQLLHNMLNILASKNYMLTEKIDIMNKKTTRDKLIEFLTQQSKLNQSNTFTIDFNRQQLADYLAVDRSGLSTEISKLVQEGLIETKRNQFTLL